MTTILAGGEKTATCTRCRSINAVVNDGDFYRCIMCGHEHAPVAGIGDRYNGGGVVAPHSHGRHSNGPNSSHFVRNN